MLKTSWDGRWIIKSYLKGCLVTYQSLSQKLGNNSHIASKSTPRELQLENSVLPPTVEHVITLFSSFSKRLLSRPSENWHCSGTRPYTSSIYSTGWPQFSHCRCRGRPHFKYFITIWKAAAIDAQVGNNTPFTFICGGFFFNFHCNVFKEQ